MSILNPLATGIFFDEKELVKFRAAVDNLVFKRHKVVSDNIFAKLDAFPKTDEINESWIGKDATVEVIGYGRDDYFEAFNCRLYPTGDAEFDTHVKNLAEIIPPIIVLSRAEKIAKGADISHVKFWPLEKTFFLKGKYNVLSKKSGEK